MLEPIVVDKVVTGFLSINCWLTGTCSMDVVNIDGPGLFYPGYLEVSGGMGDPGSIVRIEQAGSTTYRLLSLASGHLVGGLYKHEPALAWISTERKRVTRGG
jgi:hypothetical protein